jgi:hypothetical protein
MSDPEWWEDNVDYERIVRTKRVWELSADAIEEIICNMLAEKLAIDDPDFETKWDYRNAALTVTLVVEEDDSMP